MPNPRKLRKVRKVNMKDASSPKRKAEDVYASMVRAIQGHPKYDIILGALREGLPVPEIARWFAEQNWIEVTEKTFTEYLRTFKRKMPHLITGGSEDTIDSLIDAHQPNLDVETELNRLIRLQKMRLKIDVQNEKNIGKLFNTTAKELEVTMKLLGQLAEVKGLSSGGGAQGPAVTDGNDAIRKLQQDEGQRDRMYLLTNQLAKALSNGEKQSVEG